MKTKLSIFSVTIIGGLIATIPAQAASMFDDEGIYFKEETTVEFEFLQSNGWWRADFGVMNINTGEKNILLSEDLHVDPGSGWHNDNLGTPNTAVQNTTNSFTFKEETNYTLFLESVNKDVNKDVTPDTPYNTQYSTTALNPTWYNNGTGTGSNNNGTFDVTENDYDSRIDGTILPGQQRVLFKGDLFDESQSLVEILFEDNTTWGNNDFDDFVVKAKLDSLAMGLISQNFTSPASVPESGLLAALGLVVSKIFLSRFYKQQK